jgi:hypothetical protein
MSWLAASDDAAATAVEAAVSAGATASLTEEVISDAMLETAPTEADPITDETTLVACSGLSWTAETTALVAAAACSGLSWTAEATALVASAAESDAAATAG